MAIIPGKWNPGSSTLAAAAILVLLCVPYFINLGLPSLWDSNESFYAETSREMLESGDFLAPHFNYQPRTYKPPLTYWLVAGSYLFFGISEFSVRLPGTLAICGLLLLLYWTGTNLYSRTAGLLAAAIFSTSLRVFLLSRKLPIDALLLLWVSASGIFVLRALRSSLRQDWAMAYLLSALGFLTKGPIALGIPAVAVLAWAVIHRTVSSLRPHLLMGLAIFSAITLPWYLLIFREHGWTYIAPFFLRDNLGRFASESYGPSRSFFFYWTAYAAEFLPWSLVSVAAVSRTILAKNAGKPLKEAALGFPLIWCATVLVIFTLAKNKQEYYIAPVYPMMALFLAGSMQNRILDPGIRYSAHERRMWMAVFLSASGLLAALPFVILFLVRSTMPNAPALLLWLPFPAFLGGAVILARMSLRSKWVTCAFSLAGILWLTASGFTLFYLPEMEKLRPVPRLCRKIQQEMHAGDEAGYYGAALPSMAFYLRRPIFEEFHSWSMARRFRSAERVFCILTERDYNFFAQKEGLHLYVLERHPQIVTQLKAMRDPSSRRQDAELLLVCNRPPGVDSSGQERVRR